MHPFIQEHIPLKLYNTFGIGGYARYFAEADSIEVFLDLYSWGVKNNVRVFVLGMGSNVVFNDRGFEGLVIRYTARRFTFQENIAVVEAALPVSKIILEAEKIDLGGMEKLFGIPGSIGGAVYNNAGAHGVNIGEFIDTALVFEPYRDVELSAMRLLDSQNITMRKPRIVQPDYFKFGYRYSCLQNNRAVVLSVTLNFFEKPCEEIKRVRDEITQWRKEKQPLGKSAGSFFKNPRPDLSAGYLLEQVGAKGLRVGDLQVSELHANFILNIGKGTFADLEQLCFELQTKVKDKFGVELEREVEFVY